MDEKQKKHLIRMIQELEHDTLLVKGNYSTQVLGEKLNELKNSLYSLVKYEEWVKEMNNRNNTYAGVCSECREAFMYKDIRKTICDECGRRILKSAEGNTSWDYDKLQEIVLVENLGEK